MAPAQASIREQLRDDDFSSWGMRDVAYPFEPGVGEFADYGCFPLGNGRIFGHLGVDSDFSLLRGLTGPGYQTRGDNGDWQVWQEGNWQDIALSFKATAPKGPHQPVFHLGDKWTSQSIEQVLGAAIVRVKQSADFGELTILQYAVPDMPVLIREYSFVPVAGVADRDWDFFLHVANPAQETEYDGLVFHQGENRLTIQCQGFREVTGLDQCISGQKYDDGSWRCHVAYIVGKAGEPRTAVELDYSRVFGMQLDTREWWQEFTGKNVSPYQLYVKALYRELNAEGLHLNIQMEDSPLDEQIVQLPVIIETQRDHYSGSSSPMVSYHGCWVRDNNGIILTDIVNKRYGNVMRLLRYHRAACVWYGSCPMLVPLDLDLSGLDGWQPGEPGTAGDLSGIGATGFDWSGFGVEHAEVPSLIVLQHYWLWRAMHEAGQGEAADAFIAEAWGFITHNLTAMDYSTEYGVRFHGDETYTQGALYSTYDREESGQIGWPNGYIPTDFYSFDNTILHRAAASAIIEMAGSSGWDGGVIQANRIMDELDDVINDNYLVDGRVVSAISPTTGQQWLPPFAHINLRLYWLRLDYGLEEELLIGNFLRTAGLLMDESHTYPYSTPWSGYMTGHSPGYWLSAASWLGPGTVPAEFLSQLLELASPEGAWCEVLGPDGVPVDIYGRTNRIRPWESGVNYQAIVAMLENEREVSRTMSPNEWQKETEPPVATASHDTMLLALTRDNNFRNLMEQDHRLAGLEDEQVTAWDIALPFSPDELARALMFEEGDIDYHIPFLFIDRDVRGGLDRRTMKDERFWEEVDLILAEYEAAGVQLITPETLKPAWNAELNRNRDDNSLRIDIEGPDGDYDWKLKTAHEPSLIEQRLQQDGLLPILAYSAKGEMSNGGNALLGMPAEQYALLRNEAFELEITYTDEAGNEFSFTHLFPGTNRLKDRIADLDTDKLPDYVIRAVHYDSALDPLYESGELEFNPHYVLINEETANVFSGKITDWQDTGLQFSATFKDEFLKISVIITDEMTPGSGIWDSDRLNLCFDANVDSDDTDYPNGAVGHADWQKDDYWIFACPFIEADVQVMRLGGEKPDGMGNGYYGEISGSEIEVFPLQSLGAMVDEETGETEGYCITEHYVHWTIPLSELPYLDATPGSFCGFTIFYSDMDEDLSEMMYFNDWGSPDGGIEWRFWDTGLLYFEPPAGEGPDGE